ncbi:MAG: Ig-like domain-containing protein [Deltaproteobacteria bacterium]|nr:Ig-like domain-containing protein [Deltaproteobacteria bacterium]
MPSSEDLSAVTGANETTATTTTVATPVVVNGPLGDSALAFSPQSFAFGTLVTNSGSATKSFVVTNTSTYTLVLGTITGVNTNFSLTANTCTNGFSMVSNATCAFTVRFAPAVSGNLSAAITIPYDVVSASNQFSSLLSVTGAGTTLTGFAGLDAINNQTPTTMQLNWTDVAGAATYQVYNTDSGTPALLASVISANLVSGIGCAAGSCSYTATGLLPSTSHAYRVLASDFLGVQSINTHDVTSQTTADFLDITGAASAIAGACTPLTVALTLADHVTPETVQANTSIAISGLGSGTIHGDNTCGTSIASPVVIASGTSSTTFYFKDNVAESLALSATRSQNSSTTKAFTVNPSPAVASVVYAAAPATAYTASSATPMTAFTVAIKDSFGNVVTTNDSATVTLSLATGSGTLVPLSGTLTKTVSHGVATFDGVTYTKAETITIKATENASGSQYNVTSSGIAVNPSSIASVVYAVAPAATQTASSTPMSTFTAELKDAFGNVITTDSSTTITVSRVAGSGALGGTVTKTVSSGVATFDGVTYTKAETITIKATENASGKNVTSGSITVNPAAFSLSQSRLSSAASVNSGASMTVTLTAKDAFGNSNPSGIASVGFTSSLVGGTGTYGTVTDAGSGVYTAAFTGIAAGSVTLGATINAGVVTSTPSPATITVNPSPTIASVVYGVAPSTPYTASNSVAMATFTAAIVDANGNVITTNSTAHITVLGVGSTTLGGTLTKTVSGGVAAFDDITYTKAETIQIKATEDASGSNLNVTSGSVTVNPSPTVASLAWVVPPATAYTASNTTPMTTFTAAVKDSFGNIITTNSTSQLHLGLSLGSGSLSATVYVSVSNGIATFSDVTYTKPETVRLTVDLSPFSVTSSDITVTAHLAFTTQPSSSGDTDTALPQQPVVAVQDGAGATAGGATNSITLTAYSDGACTVPVASALAAVANPLSATSGVATFSGMKILKTNVVRIGASAAGITSACSSAMAIAAGAVNLVQSSVAWVPASLTANNSATSSITVTLKDANGNAIPGKTVTATSDRGADTLSGSGGSTNSSGVVNLTARSSSAGSSNITVIGNGSTLSPTAKILFLSATPLTDYQSRLFDGANPGDNSSSLKSIWKDLARSATTYAGSLFNFFFSMERADGREHRLELIAMKCSRIIPWATGD